jgi:hypothetical protein
VVDLNGDQAGFYQPGGVIFLVFLNGTQSGNCTGPGAGTTPGSGGTEPGGNGGNTITVVCPNPGGSATPINPATVARVVTDPGSIGTTAAGGTLNVLQVFELNGGNTDLPDIQTVLFQPDVVLSGGACPAGGTPVDAVVVDTDNPLIAGNPAAATVYSNAAVATPATAGSPSCNGQANPLISGNSIRFLFPDGILASAVGFSADDGAFTSNQGANQEDELGVSNQFAIGVTPGQNSRPQIVSSAVNRPPSPFPNQQSNLVVTITMDETITNGGAFNPALVVAYHNSGVTMPGTACTVGNTTDTNRIITCTGFQNGPAPASQADFTNIVLVGLRPCAVVGASNSGPACPVIGPDVNVNDASVPPRST